MTGNESHAESLEKERNRLNEADIELRELELRAEIIAIDKKIIVLEGQMERLDSNTTNYEVSRAAIGHIISGHELSKARVRESISRLYDENADIPVSEPDPYQRFADFIGSAPYIVEGIRIPQLYEGFIAEVIRKGGTARSSADGFVENITKFLSDQAISETFRRRRSTSDYDESRFAESASGTEPEKDLRKLAEDLAGGFGAWLLSSLGSNQSSKPGQKPGPSSDPRYGSRHEM